MAASIPTDHDAALPAEADPPTLGELAEVMRAWLDRGVTAESLQYSASKVWPDVELVTIPLRAERERDRILSEAAKVISGDREDQYGSALDGFTRTGEIWAALLSLDEPIAPEMVALMMTGLKLSRLAGNPTHRDSWIDGPGYMALGGEIALEAPQPLSE